MRDIDTAMAEQRAAKHYVRQKWLEVCSRWRLQSSHEPLYVTLPGSDGHDIRMLIDAGLLPTLENNAIADSAAGLVVAIEKDVLAAGALKARFPGLKVVPHDIGENLKIAKPVADLPKETVRYARALIINLDFNQPLQYKNNVHPVLEMVGRLGDLHRHPSPQNWTLLLTLNADTQGWPIEVCTRHAKTMLEVLSSDPAFESWWKKHGRDLAPVSAGQTHFSEWSNEQQQSLLLTLVPLLTLTRLAPTNWNLRATWAATYGEREQGQAAMATWIIDVDHDPDLCAEPQAQRRKLLELLVGSVGHVDGNGMWAPLD